jgi:hypothetical protein
LRLSVFVIFLGFISLNLAFWMVNASQVLPLQQAPYEEPEGITSRLLSVDLSAGNLVIAGSALTAMAIFGFVAGHLIFGGTVGIIIFALMLFVEPVRWLIAGLPIYLEQMGVSYIVVTPLTALIALVFMWFFIGLLFQRPMGDDL